MADGEFQRYPMAMRHPHHKPATTNIESKDEHGKPVFGGIGAGSPEKFPPVLVRTEDDEAYHQSLGYEPNGTCSETAFARALTVATPPDYVPAEWPKYVNGVLCENAEDEAAQMRHLGVEQEAAALIEPEDEITALKRRLRELGVETTEVAADQPEGTQASWDSPKAQENTVVQGARAALAPKRPRLPRKAT